MPFLLNIYVLILLISITDILLFKYMISSLLITIAKSLKFSHPSESKNSINLFWSFSNERKKNFQLFLNPAG